MRFLFVGRSRGLTAAVIFFIRIVSLYQRDILTFGKAREFAQMDKWQFHEELAKRIIPRHYNLENVKEDFEYGEN